jgi:predicted Ser/Thr protein kinase
MRHHSPDVASVSEIREVGRYEIVREIGRGGTAVVYLARQTDLDRSVALKELGAFRASNPAFVERFLRESRLTGALNHPNIVTVHEYFEHDGTPFIAMEYLERGSLRPYVRRLDVTQIAGVLEGLLAGLAHAASHGVVHRDLKPENVMLTSTGGVKIADFGMAKVRELHAAEELTASGTTVGTPAYMAPEQALGAAVTPRTDLYSVGVIAYELLAGRVPFDQAEAPMAIMLRHLNEEAPPLLELMPELDPQLAAWVERMLAKRPEDRPAGAADAWDELEELVIGSEGPRWRRRSRVVEPGAAPAALLSEPPTRGTMLFTKQLGRTRGRRWAAGAALGLLVAAGAGAAVLLADDSPSATTTSLRTTIETRTEETTPVGHAIEGPVLGKIRLDRTGDPLQVSLRLTSGALGAGNVVVRDGDLTDGRGLLQLLQKGARATTRGGTFGPVSLLVRKAPGVVRIDVGVEPGSFARMTARRADRNRVVVQLARAEAPVTGGTPPSSGGTDTTSTTTTPVTKPPRHKQPAIDTG